MQLHTAELCGPRKAEMPADQLSVNRWPCSISQNNTGNEAFQVKQNRVELHAKLPEIVPVIALEAVLPSWLGGHSEPCGITVL